MTIDGYPPSSSASAAVLPVNLLADVLKDRLQAKLVFAEWGSVELRPNWSGFDLLDVVRRQALARGDQSRVEMVNSAHAQLLADVRWHAEFPDPLTRTLFVATEYAAHPRAIEAFLGMVLAVAQQLQNLPEPQRKTDRTRAGRAILPTWRRLLDHIPNAEQIARVLECGLHAPGDYFVDFIFSWRLHHDAGRRYADALRMAMPSIRSSIGFRRVLPMAPEPSLRPAAALLRGLLEDNASMQGHVDASRHSMLATYETLSNLPEAEQWFIWLTTEVVEQSPGFQEYAIDAGAIDARLIRTELDSLNAPADFQVTASDDPCRI